MKKWSADRWAAASGVGYAVLMLATFGLTSAPPKYTDSPEKIGAFLEKYHTEIALMTALSGAAIVLFLWFVASLATAVRDAGQSRLARIVLIGGGVGTTLAATGDVIGLVAVRINEIQGIGSAEPLYATAYFFYTRTFWAAAAIMIATALASRRSGLFPAWYIGLSAVTALVDMIGGASLKLQGFFSPQGGMLMIGYFAFLLWVIISSTLLVRKLGHAEG